MVTRESAMRAAEVVWSAWQKGERLSRLPHDIRPATVEEGWAAQQQLEPLIGPTYGWKIAATSAAGQRHIGVAAPLPGLLFERFRCEPGDVLSSDNLHMRVVEAEFAFLMGRDVPGGASAAAVVDAVSALHLAVEVPDSRFDDFASVGGPSLLADAACAGRLVIGPRIEEWRALDLASCPTRITINGVPAAEGRGDAVLGSPRKALAWLADEVSRLGRNLRAGELVSTGTTTTPPTIGPGDEVRALFGDLGEVCFAFAR